MYFEIYATKNQVVETDNLRDLKKIHCVGGKIIYNDLTLAEYDSAERAEEVQAEMLDAYNSDNDFYRLPKE